MKIKIQGTTEIRDIEMINYSSGRDCLDDVIASCGESYEWDTEAEAYVMPLDAADWWTEYATGHAATEAEIDELWGIIDGLTTEQQQEILPDIGRSSAWRPDVAAYVYQDFPEDLSDERELAEQRVAELRSAIEYAQQDPDLYAVKAREGWAHPAALLTVTSGRYQGWVILPAGQVCDVGDVLSEEDLDSDPGVIRYVACRVIEPGDGRETDYYPPDDKMGHAIRF